jgi:flavin-dependent dehydrogenase
LSERREFDVAVVGASVAGCTAARLLAQRGARVALIEKRPSPDAYKVTCTHAILPPAAPVIARLGLEPLLYERGAIRTGAEIWTPYGGWLELPDGASRGWGVTRRTFDPLLRRLAADTPGVELLAGWALKDVRATGPAVIEVEDGSRRRITIRSRLLVGADGRDSDMARLTRVPGRVLPHNRCFYYAYWKGVKPATDDIRVWLLDPVGGAAHFPNEDGLSMLVAAFTRAQVPEVRADLETHYLRRLTGLPDGIDLRDAERVSKIMGKLEMPNIIRLRSRLGLAFIGDAALATDPLFGAGISFALQTGQWLADATGEALVAGADLEAALRRYRRRLLLRLGAHHWHIAGYSVGRRLNAPERLLCRRAARDPVVREAFSAFFTRERGPQTLARPLVLGRVLVPRPDLTGRQPAGLSSPPEPEIPLKEAA